MQALRWLTISAAFAMSLTSFASELQNINIAHFEELKSVGFRRVSAADQQASPAADTAVLTFSALGRSFELQLEPNDRLLFGMARDAFTQNIDLYRGKIAGNAESWVRIVMHNGEPRGLIWDGTELLGIEAPGDSTVATTAPVMFRLEDTIAMPGVISCGVNDAAGSGDSVYRALVSELGAAVAQGAAAELQLNISAIGDFQFVNSITGDPAVAIATRLNSVDGIFSSQVGVQISVQETEIFSTPGSEPFSGTTAAATLLNELGQYRESTARHRSQGLTHLFTGRNLDGATVGTGYSSLVCWDHFGSGLTQGTHGSTTDSLIAAHEIGHNFGAPHDSEGGPCESVPPTFLMAPTVSGSSEFSACSVEQMLPVIAAAPCIVPLVSTDVAISGTALPALMIGDNATAIFEVSNVGVDPANNVNVDVTVPTNVTFLSASASVGNCTSGAGVVSCELNTISGGSTITVSISTRAAAAGNGTVVAVATADADNNSSNNNASISVTVNPAVDQPRSKSGGGGSTGFVFLFSLLCALCRRKTTVARTIF